MYEITLVKLGRHEPPPDAFCAEVWHWSAFVKTPEGYINELGQPVRMDLGMAFFAEMGAQTKWGARQIARKAIRLYEARPEAEMIKVAGDLIIENSPKSTRRQKKELERMLKDLRR